MRRVAVLVLGDVGRSPRMQYHALSLARSPEVAHVTLIGYAGSRCVPEVEALIDSGRISLRLLREDLLPRPRSKVAYLVYAPAKALLKLGQLLFALLLLLPRVDVLLLQTPPAIPTLAAAWLARAASGCMVVVDWHNLGFSVLEHGGLGASHPYVLAARLYEALLGWSLDGHLCVTAAMSGWLREHWSVRAATLYDRPPAFFCPTPLEQRHELLRRLRPALVAPGGAPLWEEKPPSSSPRSSPWDAGGTPWTSLDSGTGQVRARPDAPALLVSSTSWSADEDFGVLLDALLLLDASLSSAPPACGGPRVLVAITGKGPLKQHYERRVAGLALRRIGIATLWLEPADYPVLLGCADLGVCLHGSTSGLDLPMKVLDMLGCGLPVCAVGLGSLSGLRGPAHSLLVHDPPLSLPGSTAFLSSSSTAPTGSSFATRGSSPLSCYGCSRRRRRPPRRSRPCARAWRRPRRSGLAGRRTGARLLRPCCCRVARGRRRRRAS